MFDALFGYLDYQVLIKIMDIDTATTILVISNTILHTWIIYSMYWWLTECAY